MSEGTAGIRIRPMASGDREFILGLAERLAAVGGPPWRDPAAMAAFHRRSLEATAAEAREDAAVLVAEAGDGAEREAGERLGVIHFTTTTDPFTGERQGYVTVLAVAAAAEGHGVGRALMAAGEAWAPARGYRLLALDAFAGNARARSVCARLGYQEESAALAKPL